ncbi:MAG: SHOCT domain-containing protein [Janthinobacterium lividum]
MDSLNAIIFLIVIGTTIWVGFDASTNKVTSDDKDYNWSNGAGAWVVGCILLWIVVFPWYLVRRARVLRVASTTVQTYRSQEQWPPAPQLSTSLTSEIEHLSALHKQGVISDDEFILAKKRLLEN